MNQKTKIENFCYNHFRDRLRVMFNDKEKVIVGIIDGNAILTFAQIQDTSSHVDCKAPNCVESATRQYIRIDLYDGEVPEMP